MAQCRFRHANLDTPFQERDVEGRPRNALKHVDRTLVVLELRRKDSDPQQALVGAASLILSLIVVTRALVSQRRCTTRHTTEIQKLHSEQRGMIFCPCPRKGKRGSAGKNELCGREGTAID